MGGFLERVLGRNVARAVTIGVAVGISALTGGLAAGVFGAATSAGGFFAASLGISGLAASALGLASSLVAGALLTSSLLGRGPGDQFAGSNAPLADALGTRALSGAATSNSVPWAVGNSYLSGQVFDTVLSTDQQSIWYAIAVSEVGTNQTFTFDLNNTYWGDKKITFDATDRTKVISIVDNAGTSDTKISGNVFMYFYTNGSSSGQNTARTAINVMSDSAIPAANRWTATNTMTGAAFVIIKIVYNQTAGVTGLVTPRFRLMSNAAYAKPGSIWYEYMTNQRFGLGMPASSVDQASANAWDAYSDEVISYFPAGGGPALTQPRYRFNGVIDTKQSIRSNLDLMMANADCYFRFDEINNKWQVVPNAPSAPVFAFDDSNILGAFSFSPKTLRESYTEAVVSFPDSNILDQQNNVYLSLPDSLLKPNLPANSLNLTYSLTNESVQAQYLANRILEQAQEDLVISFNASFTATGIQAGDVVSVTNTTFGWAGKLFRVAEVKEESNEALGLFVNLLCMEYNPAVYDEFSITQFTPSPNTNLPDPTFFGPLIAPTVANAIPSASVPSFVLTATIPAAGISTTLDLFIGTTNSFADARLLQTLPFSVSTGYLQGSPVSITVTSLVAGTYYFFSQVSNAFGTSAPSSPSVSFVWNPMPSSSVSGVAVNPNWLPAVILVPANANNVATTTGQQAVLEIYLGTSLLAYSASSTDIGMPNNSWRIDTTMISSGLTLTGPVTFGGTGAQWTLTAMTTASATLTVSLRYKDSAGVVVSIGSTIVGFTQVLSGTSGSTAYIDNNPLVFYQNTDGTWPSTSQTMQFNLNGGGAILSKSQQISVSSTGLIVFGAVTGSNTITVVTTGNGTSNGTVQFLQASSGITLTGAVQTVPTTPNFTTLVIYRRSTTTAPETVPPNPTGGIIDTSTGAFFFVPSGWSVVPPIGTNVLYQSQLTTTYERNSGNFIINASWSAATQSSQTLSNGARYIWNLTGSQYVAVQVPVLVYFRQITASVPSTPTGGSASFSGGLATVTPPSGWTVGLDNTNYDLKYSSSTSVSTVSDTIIYNLTGWTLPFFVYNPTGTIANQYIVRNGNQPPTVPNPTAAELQTVFTRNNPRLGDAVVIQYSPNLTYVSFSYTGTTWILGASFIKGDMVVSGSITALQIAALTISGDKISAGAITADKITVNTLSAINANLGTVTAGSVSSATTLIVGSSPVRVGTTMTGSGATINVGGLGAFALGNATRNITFDGTQVTVNGRLVVAGNIVANTITANECFIDGTTIIGAAGTSQIQVGTINTGQVANQTGTVTYLVENYTSSGFVLTENDGSGTTSNYGATFWQWSTRPNNYTGGTVTFPYRIVTSNQQAQNPGNGAAIRFSMWQEINATLQSEVGTFSTAFLLFDGSTYMGTASFTFSSGSAGSGPMSLRIGPFNSSYPCTLSTSAATISAVFSGILNPNPRSKTAVMPPLFNTYP